MIIGIIFLLIAISIFIKEYLNMEEIDNERVISMKKDINKDRNFRFRIVLGIFSLVLGIFRILNVIIY